MSRPDRHAKLMSGSTPSHRFAFQSMVIVFNVLVNICCIPIAIFFYRISVSPPPEWTQRLADDITYVVTPLLLAIGSICLFIYEKPLREWAKAIWDRQEIAPAQQDIAARRLLHEPFFIVKLNVILWGVAAFIYAGVFDLYGVPDLYIGRSLVQSLLVGVINATAAFFLVEHLQQSHHIPFFFPTGGVSRVHGAKRVTISKRLAALFIACCVIPLTALMLIVGGTSRISTSTAMDPAVILDQLRTTVIGVAIIFFIAGLLIVRMIRINITTPFEAILEVLRDIGQGQFNRRVQVQSNDELGFTGDAINEMAAGLEERERMRFSLELARSVQHGLLPSKPPQIPGLEIAGLSHYCDETGGDYYDFFTRPDYPGCVSVVVGDVAGHGVPAALLMATVRAALRQRAETPGPPAQVITDVNRRICQDTEGSGQFMTLFYMEIDPQAGRMTWVRAGHDPAMVLCPDCQSIEELTGDGVPVGVAKWSYEEHSRPMAPGELLFIGTDGLWEARNLSGAMFGKERIADILKQHKGNTVEELLASLAQATNDFRHGPANDDVTMICVRRA